MVALLARAMGAQSASLRRVRGQSVHTPFVTGVLTHPAEYAVKALFAAYDHLRHRSPEPAREHVERTIFYFGLWLAFAIGTLCGGIAESHWRFWSLLAPLGLLGLIIVLDLARPVHE